MVNIDDLENPTRSHEFQLHLGGTVYPLVTPRGLGLNRRPGPYAEDLKEENMCLESLLIRVDFYLRTLQR